MTWNVFLALSPERDAQSKYYLVVENINECWKGRLQIFGTNDRTPKKYTMSIESDGCERTYTAPIADLRALNLRDSLDCFCLPLKVVQFMSTSKPESGEFQVIVTTRIHD